MDNSRKDYYEACPDTLEIIYSRIKEGIKRRMSESKHSLETIEKSINEDNSLGENREFYCGRVDNIKKAYEQVKSLLEFLPGKKEENEK